MEKSERGPRKVEQTLRAGLPRLGLTLTDGQIAQLVAYGTQLLEKNQVMNLTAITAPSQVAELHFLDSLALLRFADFAGKRVIDVGCGAGLPGLPLKIAEPGLRLTLLDSLGKRMQWLQEVTAQLGVEAECLTARAEEAVATRREQYDIAVSRAVARLNVLCELCLPYVRVGGVLLAMKGERAEEEAQEARRAIAALGGTLEKIETYPVGAAQHRLVCIRKTKPTPPRYPRRFAKIKQQPL